MRRTGPGYIYTSSLAQVSPYTVTAYAALAKQSRQLSLKLRAVSGGDEAVGEVLHSPSTRNMSHMSVKEELTMPDPEELPEQATSNTS